MKIENIFCEEISNNLLISEIILKRKVHIIRRCVYINNVKRVRLNHATTHHHPPPAKIYPPPPTTIHPTHHQPKYIYHHTPPPKNGPAPSKSQNIFIYCITSF